SAETGFPNPHGRLPLAADVMALSNRRAVPFAR
ncbi:unnamed protein product, partial [Urochloa humidicola]